MATWLFVFLGVAIGIALDFIDWCNPSSPFELRLEAGVTTRSRAHCSLVSSAQVLVATCFTRVVAVRRRSLVREADLGVNLQGRCAKPRK